MLWLTCPSTSEEIWQATLQDFTRPPKLRAAASKSLGEEGLMQLKKLLISLYATVYLQGTSTAKTSPCAWVRGLSKASDPTNPTTKFWTPPSSWRNVVICNVYVVMLNLVSLNSHCEAAWLSNKNAVVDIVWDIVWKSPQDGELRASEPLSVQRNLKIAFLARAGDCPRFYDLRTVGTSNIHMLTVCINIYYVCLMSFYI